MVNHPEHYKGKKECIEAMAEVYGDEKTASFCILNAFKYVWRIGKKESNSHEQDLSKAKWYYSRFLYYRHGTEIEPSAVSIEHIIDAVKRYTDVYE